MNQDEFMKFKKTQNFEDILKSIIQKSPQNYRVSLQDLTLQEHKKKEPSLIDEVHTIKDRQLALESRVDSLEFKTNISPIQNKIDKIEEFTKRVFFDIPIIVNISYKPSSSGLILLAIHNSDNISNAIDQIHKGISKLEDAFPTVYFEPWVLHITEVQNQHIQNAKTIFQR